MTALSAFAPRQLPVWQTVGACFALVVRNLGQLARIGWLWVLIVAAAYVALDQVPLGEEESILLDAIAAFAGISVTLLEWLFLASIAVAWHRLILRQERVTGLVYLRLDRTVWLYLLYSLLLAVLVGAPILLSTALLHLAVSLVFSPETLTTIALPALTLGLAAAFVLLPASALLFLLVLPRLSLVLPAAALERPLSLRDAWRVSRANTLRLALATLLCTLPGILPFLGDLNAYVRAWTTGEELSELVPDSFAYRVLMPLAHAVLTVFAVALLSLTYRFFLQPREESAPPAP